MPNIIRGHVKYPPKPEPAPVKAVRVFPKRNCWTPTEDVLIYHSYRTLGAIIIGERLSRSTFAVKSRAIKLGVAGDL